MSGKPTIPQDVIKTIVRLHQRGRTFAEIMEETGVSRYTVRRALRPDYAEQERERQRTIWPQTKRARDGSGYNARRRERYSASKAPQTGEETENA